MKHLDIGDKVWVNDQMSKEKILASVIDIRESKDGRFYLLKMPYGEAWRHESTIEVKP